MESQTEAAKARDKLASQLLHSPEVSLIDIGLDPDAPIGGEQGIVVRVHLRKPSSRQAMRIPDEVDGVPVRVVIADYQLE